MRRAIFAITASFTAAIGITLVAGGATAQPQPATNALGGLSCAGKMVTVRYGVIKPGQMALYRKAVADHQAWYASHGNKTTVAFIQVATAKSGKPTYDDGAAMSIVTYDPAPQPAHDAAYDAFVKEYRDSSTVSEEHRGCMK